MRVSAPPPSFSTWPPSDTCRHRIFQAHHRMKDTRQRSATKNAAWRAARSAALQACVCLCMCVYIHTYIHTCVCACACECLVCICVFICICYTLSFRGIFKNSVVTYISKRLGGRKFATVIHHASVCVCVCMYIILVLPRTGRRATLDAGILKKTLYLRGADF